MMLRLRLWGLWPWPLGIVVIMVADLSYLLLSDEWFGSVGNAIERANGGLFITSPLIAAATAYLATAWTPASTQRLIGAGTHPIGDRRLTFALFINGATQGVIAHGIVVIGALIAVAFTSPSDSPTWAAIAYGLVPILLSAGIGAACSVAAANRWSPFVAAAATLLIAYLSISGTLTGLFSVGGWRDVVGWTYSAVAAIRYAAFALAALALLIATTYLRLRGKVRRSLTAGALCIAGIAAAAWVSPQTIARLVPASAVVPTSCLSDGLEVCYARGHTRFIKENAHALDKVAAILKAAGADVPRIFTETALGAAAPAGVGALLLTSNPNVAPLTLWDATYALTDPTACPQLRSDDAGPDVENLVSIQGLIADWAASRAGGADAIGADAAARGVTKAEVALLYNSMLRCAVTPEAISIIKSP